MGMLYKSLPGFLGDEIRIPLLEYVLANESHFEPAKVGNALGLHQDDRVRVSRRLENLGDFGPVIEQRVLAQVPDLIAALGLMPFQPDGVETEIVAHGDGAFFKPHIDTFTGTGRNIKERLLSLVYYFYQEPRSFTGGSLRLFPLPGLAGTGMEKGVDITIEQDTAVAFPSWLPHEVMRISCPSRKFAESRFAINCWIRRRRSTPGG
jgi:SM-20-related protein